MARIFLGLGSWRQLYKFTWPASGLSEEIVALIDGLGQFCPF